MAKCSRWMRERSFVKRIASAGKSGSVTSRIIATWRCPAGSTPVLTIERQVRITVNSLDEHAKNHRWATNPRKEKNHGRSEPSTIGGGDRRDAETSGCNAPARAV